MHRNIQNSMATVKIQLSSSYRGIYKFSKLLGFIFTHGWLSHSMSLGGWPIALTYSLTDSILILFIKQFSLHPLLSIAFVQECSVIFRKVFWQGKTGKMYILPSKWIAWKEFVKHLQRLKLAILVSCVFLSFLWPIDFCSHIDETWKRYMTVLMNPTQCHGWQALWRQSQKVRLCLADGEIKSGHSFFFLAREFDDFHGDSLSLLVESKVTLKFL